MSSPLTSRQRVRLALAHKQPEMRVAGIEGLRVTALNEETVVGPLVKVARDDADETVWRAAVIALGRVTRTPPIIRTGASDEERKKTIEIWYYEWQRAKRAEAAKTKK